LCVSHFYSMPSTNTLKELGLSFLKVVYWTNTALSNNNWPLYCLKVKKLTFHSCRTPIFSIIVILNPFIELWFVKDQMMLKFPKMWKCVWKYYFEVWFYFRMNVTYYSLSIVFYHTNHCLLVLFEIKLLVF